MVWVHWIVTGKAINWIGLRRMNVHFFYKQDRNYHRDCCRNRDGRDPEGRGGLVG